MAKDLNRTEN